MKTGNNYQLNTFLNIIDAIPASVYWKDLSGKYLGCNKYMLNMIGLAREDVLGKTDRDLVWEDIADELQQIDNLVIKNNAKYEVEETPVIAGSQKRTYLSTKTPLYDGEKIIGMIGVSIDITDRKNVDKLRQEKEVIYRMSRTLEMLSSSIAHEVKTPLAGVNINIENLDSKLQHLFKVKDSIREEDKQEISAFIKNIKFAINRSSNIISMLLIKLRSIFGDKDSGAGYKKELRITSIKSDINNALEEYPFFENERGLVVWHHEENIDFKYNGNTLITKHLLFNLVKNSLNAIKEAEKGKIHISLKTSKEFNYLIFKDTASGIPPEILEFLFRPFVSKNGTGLGLSFCKMTMQSYGGDISCNSKEGEFTEFVLSFPTI